MRKYHRWLSVVFGAFLLWIAATGVMIQLADLKAASEEEAEAGPAPQAGAVQVSRAQQGSNAGLVVKATFICPAEMTCLPKPGPDSAKSWVSFLQGLHSGESFGPFGTVISIVSGLALFFFACSGLWMYIQMWRYRKRRGLRPRWWWQ
jgi:hypothetical protein